MPPRSPAPVSEILGQVLGRVAKATGSGAAVDPVWRSVVGALTAAHAVPTALAAGVLVVRCDAAPWREELERRHDELLSRLAAQLGRGAVRRIVFQLP